MIDWRMRSLGDGFIGRALLPNDFTGVAFRAAIVLAVVMAVVRAIAAAF